jgi:hypothetical protein
MMTITIPAASARNHMAHRPGLVLPATGAGREVFPEDSGNLTHYVLLRSTAIKSGSVPWRRSHSRANRGPVEA